MCLMWPCWNKHDARCDVFLQEFYLRLPDQRKTCPPGLRCLFFRLLHAQWLPARTPPAELHPVWGHLAVQHSSGNRWVFIVAVTMEKLQKSQNNWLALNLNFSKWDLSLPTFAKHLLPEMCDSHTIPDWWKRSMVLPLQKKNMSLCRQWLQASVCQTDSDPA